MKEVSCKGSESSLFDCAYIQWGDEEGPCSRGSNVAGVVCYNTAGKSKPYINSYAFW